MENARATRRPWRSWAAIALVMAALALVQACGDSGKSTGPTSNASLQLKLRRANGEVPVGCQGTYNVSGPGVNITNAALPQSGKISFQGQIGQTYLVSVELTCGVAQVTKQSHGETLSGSTQITLKSEGNEATITLTVSKATGVSCQSPIGVNTTSDCVCQFQSPGPANIEWKGASPTGPSTARFPGSPTKGSFPVTCTVNGISSSTFNIQVVESDTVNVTVENFPLGLKRKLPQNRIRLAQGCCPFFVRFVGQVGSTQISRDESRTFQVKPNVLFEASCNSSFDGVFHHETVTQSTTIVLDGGSECG
jgi:hypothetical protein